jgi:hypothetical protein
MRTIPRVDLIALEGAPDAHYAVFNADGSLYFCTTAKRAGNDEDYWRAGGFEIRQVEGQP